MANPHTALSEGFLPQETRINVEGPWSDTSPVLSGNWQKSNREPAQKQMLSESTE